MRKILLAGAAALVVAATALAAADPFPERIELPKGWAPEGVEIAPGGTFYVGSIPTGDILAGDLRTGEYATVVDVTGRNAIGIEYAHGLLFVAGGGSGKAYVYDAETGATVAEYQLAADPLPNTTFINDVVVTNDAAWFTDSRRAVLYKVAIAGDGTPATTAEVVPLTGDFQLVSPATQNNLNGIDATPDGKTLVVVQSNTGFLFTVDAATGETSRIDLGGVLVDMGDGILLHGKTLYVVRNRANEIVVISLSADLSSGEVVDRITNDDFAGENPPRLQVPTTLARHGAEESMPDVVAAITRAAFANGATHVTIHVTSAPRDEGEYA